MIVVWSVYLVVAILFYLVGSIPSGYIVAKLAGINDIRQHGSGNIGATNMGRVLGPLFFFLVLFLDFIKAYGALYWVSVMGYPNVANQWALLLLIGNTHSLFLHGQGGKGVATSAGILAWCTPTLFYLFSVLWVGITLATQTPWVASSLVMFFLPYVAYVVVGSRHTTVLMFCMMVIVLVKHWPNISRFYYKRMMRFPFGKDPYYYAKATKHRSTGLRANGLKTQGERIKNSGRTD